MLKFRATRPKRAKVSSDPTALFKGDHDSFEPICYALHAVLEGTKNIAVHKGNLTICTSTGIDTATRYPQAMHHGLIAFLLVVGSIVCVHSFYYPGDSIDDGWLILEPILLKPDILGDWLLEDVEPVVSGVYFETSSDLRGCRIDIVHGSCSSSCSVAFACQTTSAIIALHLALSGDPSVVLIIS